jgi:hypothetical protein
MKHLLVALDGDRAGQAATEKLLEQLQAEVVAGGLSASVVRLPDGQDADGLLRSNGSPAIEGLIAGARHWLEWRFDRVLAPLSMSTGEASLETLQAVERDGKTLVEQLPDGVLRRSAEQRLDLALRGSDEQGTGVLPTAFAAVEPCDASVRRRAERRALRLFVHAPESRELLQCLTFQDPACRAAMEWLGSLAVVAVDGAIAPMALQLAGQLQGAVGAALAQAAEPGADVIGVLKREPQAELQAVLDQLEPMGPSTPLGGPTVERNTEEQDRIINGLGTTVACPLTGDGALPALKPKHAALASNKTLGAVPWRF